MKRKIIFIAGIIIFIAFIWLMTSVGLQNNAKKHQSSTDKQFVKLSLKDDYFSTDFKDIYQ